MENRVDNHVLAHKKQSRLHAMEALGGRGGIAPTHSRSRHLMGVSGQRHAPAALLPPGKGPPVPIVQEAGWAPEPVCTQRLEDWLMHHLTETPPFCL
jgi:hypothetical protein